MNESGGVIEVSDDVIRHVIHICSKGVPGVAGVSEESSMDRAFKMLRSTDFPKGIRISNGASDRHKKVDVSIEVEFGIAIPAVACKFQEKVKDEVERIAGVTVEEVNVHVDGVRAGAGSTSTPRVVTAPQGQGAVQGGSDTYDDDPDLDNTNT